VLLLEIWQLDQMQSGQKLQAIGAQNALTRLIDMATSLLKTLTGTDGSVSVVFPVLLWCYLTMGNLQQRQCGPQFVRRNFMDCHGMAHNLAMMSLLSIVHINVRVHRLCIRHSLTRTESAMQKPM